MSFTPGIIATQDRRHQCWTVSSGHDTMDLNIQTGVPIKEFFVARMVSAYISNPFQCGHVVLFKQLYLLIILFIQLNLLCMIIIDIAQCSFTGCGTQNLTTSPPENPAILYGIGIIILYILCPSQLHHIIMNDNCFNLCITLDITQCSFSGPQNLPISPEITESI